MTECSKPGDIKSRLQEAMSIIEQEIEENQGIYPYHGGRLSQAELCRRARVDNTVLGNDTHKASTRPWVNAWLLRMKAKMVTGKRAVRKTVTKRADDMRQKVELLAAEVVIAKLEAAALRQKYEGGSAPDLRGGD